MGAMKTILFSLATTETAGPSAEVRVPTRKSTFSFRISSRATRTASLASALESRMISSILRPSTPPLALSSSTYICAPFEAGSPNSAAGPDRGIGMPTLIGFWASAAAGRASSAATSRVSRRVMTASFGGRSALQGGQARDLDADPVHGRGCGDVETAVVVIAPGEVRRGLRNLDHPEAHRLRIEDVHASRPAAVDVALRVDLHAVGCALALPGGLRPHPAAREAAVGLHVEDADVLAGGVVDEEATAVPREAEAVGPVEIVHHERRALRIAARSVDALEAEFLLALHSVEVHAAVRRVAEVDAAVGRADDVVGAVELLAVVVGGHGRDAPVRLGARDLARGVLAGEEAPLPVPGEAVGLVARLAERGDAVGGRPPTEMVPRHVAPQEILPRGVPEGPLGEKATARDLLELHLGPYDGGEARIADLDRHFLIGSPGLPAAYQSLGLTSSITTHTASLGRPVTSVMAPVTRLAISSFRSLPQPS